MDLVKVLRERIDSLEVGDHTAGLRAVLQHVQVAASHLARGSSAGDDTAFTDTIYRTNQAFEGSLKEAFRVLAGKDPSKERPFDIENYFQSQSILRPRVLEQFSTYRTDWRNPSTHDYKLDFDEDEALLAIVSVCAFAIVLIDQVAAKLSYDKALASSKGAPADSAKPLPDVLAEQLMSLRLPLSSSDSEAAPVREIEVIGTVAGRLAALFPNSKVDTEVQLSAGGRERADIVVTRDGTKVLIEAKRGRFAANARSISLSQLAHYIALSGVKDAILYFYDDEGGHEMEREDYPLPGVEARVIVIRPKRRR